MILREHGKDDNERVTQGCPSLSSKKRRTITDAALLKIYQSSLLAEYRNNEESALAKDGSIANTMDWEQVVGIPLTGARFITRLRKLNNSLWFEPSKADPTKTGVYVLKSDLKGGQEKQYLAGFETEWNPEFSLRVTDKEGKAKGHVPGWRKTLMRLIRTGLISEPAAFKLFGPPSRESENWARFTA